MREREAAPIDAALLAPVLRPLAQARTLPGEAYASAAVFDWERRHFFDGSWYCLGRSADLARVGDQRAVPVGAASVLLVRDDAGTLRGYFNVCRHRGHELVEPGTARTARGIKCPYHAWVYGLDGRCRATSRFAKDDPDPGVDPGEFPLVGVPVAEWHGWVFANVSGDAPRFAEHIGNADQVVADYQPADLVQGAASEYEVAANWKLVIENYLECYHCASIHPELCQVTVPESGPGYPEPATGLWVGGPLLLRDHAETMSLTGQSGGVPIGTVPAARRRAVGYAAVLPNLLVSPHPDYVMTHRLEPLGPDRTKVECAWLFPPEAFDRPGFTPDYAADFWDRTNRQDWAACESVQRNAASPGYRPGPISPWESDVGWAMAVVARSYLTGRLTPHPSRVTTSPPE